MLNRLPPDYRRRYYVNLTIIGGFIAFVVLVGKLNRHDGTIAVEAFVGLLLLFTLVWPLFRLLRSKPRPGRLAFILYGIWIASFALVAASIAEHGPPALGFGMLLFGTLCMLTFFVAYRKAVFPGVFDGEFRERWNVVRQAQRAARAEQAEFLDSIRASDQRAEK